MSGMSTLVLQLSDWLAFAGHFALLSLLSVGGAVSVLPEMHRFLVVQQHWLSENQFTSAVALAQASPGPNVIVTAMLGCSVGLATGNPYAAIGGALLALVSMLLPSSLLTYFAARWGQKHRDHPGVRAFKQGMAPLVVGLMFSAGWLLISAHDNAMYDWPLWLLSAASALIIWRTRLHLLWLLGVGALLGWFGVV